MGDVGALDALRSENQALAAQVAELHARLAEMQTTREQIALWHTLPEGLLILDTQGRIARANDAAARMMGQPVARLMGHRVYVGWPYYTMEGVALDEAERHTLLEQALMAPHTDLLLGVDPPGHHRVWVQVSVSALQDDQGRPDGAICILHDITAQRAATDALRASEARFRGLFETIGECVIFLDADYRVALANPVAEHLLGLSRQEMIGCRLTELAIGFLGSDGRALDNNALASVMRRGLVRPYHELLVGIRRAGAEVVWGSVRTTPMRDADGNLQGIVMAVADVTERVRAEQTLRSRRDELETAVAQRTAALQAANARLVNEVEERRRVEATLRDERSMLRRVLDTNPNLIFLKDRNGRFVLVNQAMAAAYGLSPQEVEGLDEWELAGKTGAPIAEVPRFLAEDQQVIESQQPMRIPGVLADYPNLHAMVETIKVPLTLRGEAGYILCVGVDISARAQVERALQESEAFLRQVIGTVPSCVFVKDRAGRHVLSNRLYADAYGLPNDVIIGKTNRELATLSGLPMDEAEVFDAQDRLVLDTGQPLYLSEEPITLVDGTVRWFQIVKLLLSVQGHPEYILGVTHDVTERRHMTEALRLSETFLRQVLDADPNLVFVKGGQGRYLLVNRAFGDLFGLTPEQCVELSLEDLARFIPQPEGLLERLLQADALVLAEGRPVVLEDVRVRTFSGVERCFHMVKTSLIYRGSETCVLGVAQDVTEQMAAELALRQSEARYRNLFEAASDAILLATLGGRIVDCNPRACQLYRRPYVELVGASFDELVAPEALPLLAEWRAATVENGSGFVEALNLQAGSIAFPAELSARLVDIEGQSLVLVHVRDLTERRRLEEQLRQAVKMEAIGRLAGGVAHDFNNLLTVINGYSELVLNLMPDGDPLREDVEQILGAGQRAAGLTRRLLAFSRQQVLELRPCDVNEAIEGMAKMLQRIIGEDVRLEMNLADGLSLVRADSSQIEQVLVNLAVNARDAMPAGGTLTIRTENVSLAEPLNASHLAAPPGDYVLISVQDTGEGMAPQVLGHLFEPFYTTKEVGKGTGLGLAMIYGILKQFGGGVDVTSAPGQGSRFDLYLPSHPFGAALFEEVPHKLVLPRGHETVLLVEDQAMVSGLATRFLMQLGYNVLEVSGGREATDLLLGGEPEVHLVLTDVIMPEMSGPEMVQGLRRAGLRPRILYMSGYAHDVIEARGQKLDAPLLQKPFTMESLALAVRQELDAPAAP